MKKAITSFLAVTISLAMSGCASQGLSLKDYLKQLKEADITCEDADVSKYEGKTALEAGVPEHEYVSCYDDAGDSYSLVTFESESNYFDYLVSLCTNYDEDEMDEQEMLVGKYWLIQSDSSINELSTFKDALGGEIQTVATLCDKNNI